MPRSRGKKNRGRSKWAAIRDAFPNVGNASKVVRQDAKTLGDLYGKPVRRDPTTWLTQPEPPKDTRHGWYQPELFNGKGGVDKVPAGERKRAIPLFAYGNLCFRQVLEDRIGHAWPGEYRAAVLEDHRITRTWPRYAVPSKGQQAHGFLLPDLTDEDLEKIDRYEGVHSGVYRRALVRINGRMAWLYVIGPRGKQRLNSKLAEEAAHRVRG
jgi:hypothetical protein